MKNWASKNAPGIALFLCVVGFVGGMLIVHQRNLNELRENNKLYWECERCVLPENSREPIYTNGCTRVQED